MVSTNFNNFSPPPGSIVVSKLAGQGQYTTITSALAASSSGQTVFVLPGNFTENFTLPANIYLVAATPSGISDQVTITGKITFSGSSSSTISGFKIVTNADYCIVHSGSNAATLNFKDCSITGTGNSSINYTNSNASSSTRFFNCVFGISGAEVTHFVSTSPGILQFLDGTANASADTTASTASSTVIIMRYINWSQPIALSTSGSLDARFCNIVSNSVLSLNIGSGVTATIQNSSIVSGTGVAIQADGTVSLYESIINSSNANAITGAGTLNYAGVDFLSGSTISTTTKNPISQTVFQGGTGQTSWTTGDTLYSSATNTLSKLPIGASGQVYSVVAGVPSWVNLSTILNYISSVLVATTATLNANYLNGVSGVGATLVNAGALAAFVVDGQTPAINSRVLVKNQSSSFQNGIYTITTLGTGAVAWVLTRSTDYNTPSEINVGDIVPVQTGTINANTTWIEGSAVTTIGTDPITFTQFSSAPITTTQFDVLVGGANNTISNVGPGSTGQYLQSAGNASNPAYSTATLPSTATGTGKVLISDGTNWVASTPTFPNTAAGTGTILRADGTNWVATTNIFPNTATAGALIAATATNVVGQIADVAVGQVLASGGVGVIPAYTASPSVTSITLSSGTALSTFVEGSFTPAISIGASTVGITYTAQNGFYQRVGNTVHIYCRVICSSIGGLTGSILLTGLPVTATAASGAFGIPIPVYDAVTFSSTSYREIGLLINASATTAQFFKSGTGVGLAALSAGTDTIGNTFQFWFSGMYYVG